MFTLARILIQTVGPDSNFICSSWRSVTLTHHCMTMVKNCKISNSEHEIRICAIMADIVICLTLIFRKVTLRNLFYKPVERLEWINDVGPSDKHWFVTSSNRRKPSLATVSEPTFSSPVWRKFVKNEYLWMSNKCWQQQYTCSGSQKSKGAVEGYMERYDLNR